MGFIRPGRLRSLLLASLASILVCTVYLYWTPTTASATVSVVPSTAFEVPLSERQKEFWRTLQPILDRHHPNCPSPEKHGDAGANHFDPNTDAPRPDVTVMSAEAQKSMGDAHANFIEEIKHPAKALKPVHTPGKRGLVSTAGAKYLPVFLSSLRMLRRAGSTLPVELYMKDAGEYEKKICRDVLPQLDAQCIVLADVMGKNVIEHYQLKIFAVLFSSFEQIVWMDADCFPLGKPEDLLESDPFASTGLVTWPDFWASSASPLYYKISGQEAPPMTARQSSETGVFLVSKKTHLLPLMLAAYYNFYGPSHYFRLLTQGGPGEGDKETFLHAAMALGAPFYTVSERVQAIGHQNGDKLSGSAMAQTDPREDLALTKQDKWRVKDSSVAPAPRLFFVHANYPKFNPGDNVFGLGWETTPTIKADGSDSRAWTAPPDTLRRFGYDAEKAYWEEIKWVTCNLENVFESWKHKAGLCDKVEDYWKNVFAEPHDDDPTFTQDG
ncbi:putative alpha-mannosyltransferase [Penicillium oxalicum 114-2]|uniref:Putative alpha-mannosyltransferase n=1 Tax=Penicillium oxalicum (strain 114-2 / CGMCC 5302) TaxID=933388 RepID=S7ZUJ7_PENO1|nr:putative alpha-mannosyltransferase [Penicillium oxalicum 114-2]